MELTRIGADEKRSRGPEEQGTRGAVEKSRGDCSRRAEKRSRVEERGACIRNFEF